METFTLLNASFFLHLEEGNEAEIKNHYEEMRSMIVEFAHGDDNWRNIHTGLTLFISEVATIIEEAIGTILKYGKRILAIAKGLISQIELIAKNAIEVPAAHAKKNTSPEDDSDSSLTMTCDYADFCEIINMAITMKLFNGGRAKAKAIIAKFHKVFGWNKTEQEYYNNRNAFLRRCPSDGNGRAYFMEAVARALNAEYSGK